MNKIIIITFVICLGLLVQYLWRTSTPSMDKILANVDIPDALKEHTNHFTPKEVVKVADGVYVALNYALANCIMLVGPGGKVIVDTTESLEAAHEIAAEFRTITKAETKAIIYTHHHTDHVGGSWAFIDEDQEPPEVWAHNLFLKEEKRVLLNKKAFVHRAMHQFGIPLGKAHVPNLGIGGLLRFNQTQRSRLGPTKFVGNDRKLTLAGINMTLIHVPGETADQIGVWLPDIRVLLCADDLYMAFPNLYAIRGVTPRDVMDWVESLDKMRQLRPTCLVGSHCKPVCGEQKVYELLSDYMYGIQYVHDQTIRYINKGWHPDEIAKTVKLPPELASNPNLMQYYGTVPWSVKAVYIMYMGWFSGEAVDLYPVSPAGRADRMIKLVGKSGLLRAAASALTAEDHQWALELAAHVYRLDSDDIQAKKIRRDAMAGLASQQMSAPGRNFYMTEMIKDEGLFPEINPLALLDPLPCKTIIQMMKSRLKVENLPPGEHITGCFHFTDSKTTFCAIIRKSVMNISFELVPDWDFKQTTTESLWKEVITGQRSPFATYIVSNIEVEGDTQILSKFMTYFDKY